MSDTIEILWKKTPQEHDYPAAESYLSLIYDGTLVERFINLFKQAPVRTFKAKDIFRASGLSLLGVSNSHVEKDRNKIKDKKALSPLLLVRDTTNGKVIIADGYHRLCAVYSIDEDALIACCIV